MHLSTSAGLLCPGRCRLEAGVKYPILPRCRERQYLARSIERAQQARTCPLRVASEQATAVETLTDSYNEQMARQMNWSNPFEYHFDRGLYFHEVGPNLLCGTQPRNPEEVRTLANTHHVRTIINLQQDSDMQYWGIDFGANERACAESGIRLVRRPVRNSATSVILQVAGQAINSHSSVLFCRPGTLILTACVTCYLRQ
jgi:hypothetical protein